MIEENWLMPSELVRAIEAALDPYRGFYPALDRAEIRRVRFHDLRHSWVSNLLEAGENMATDVRARDPEATTRSERSNGRSDERNNSAWVQNGY